MGDPTYSDAVGIFISIQPVTYIIDNIHVGIPFLLIHVKYIKILLAYLYIHIYTKMSTQDAVSPPPSATSRKN